MKTNERGYITLSIRKEDGEQIPTLIAAYKKEKGVRSISKMDAVGFAIQNEIERFSKGA